MRRHDMRYGQLAADDYGSGGQRPPLVLLHGLTFDRRHWTPVLQQPSIAASDRRVLSFDLPGHGESPDRDSYRGAEVAEVLHDAIKEAGADAPVVAGHSIGGALATTYAGRYPVSGVVNLDQPLRAGRGAGELPEPARKLVRTRTTPRQDLLLGYWDELMSKSAEQLDEARARELAAIRSAGVPYHYIAGNEVPAAYQSW